MVDSLSQHTNESSLSLATLALKCLIQLLCDLPHFNFRSNIIQTLVPLMNSQNDSVRDANSKKNQLHFVLRFLSGFLLLQLSEMTCRGIETLFKRDRKGEATLETVRTISQMIKANSYKSRPQVLSHTITLFLSFLFFPLFCCPSSLLILFSIYLLLCPGSKDISCTQLDRTIGRRN